MILPRDLRVLGEDRADICSVVVGRPLQVLHRRRCVDDPASCSIGPYHFWVSMNLSRNSGGTVYLLPFRRQPRS